MPDIPVASLAGVVLVGEERGRQEISQSTMQPMKPMQPMQIDATGQPADAGGIHFFGGRKGTALMGLILSGGPAKCRAMRVGHRARMQPHMHRYT